MRGGRFRGRLGGGGAGRYALGNRCAHRRRSLVVAPGEHRKRLEPPMKHRIKLLLLLLFIVIIVITTLLYDSQRIVILLLFMLMGTQNKTNMEITIESRNPLTLAGHIYNHVIIDDKLRRRNIKIQKTY